MISAPSSSSVNDFLVDVLFVAVLLVDELVELLLLLGELLELLGEIGQLLGELLLLLGRQVALARFLLEPRQGLLRRLEVPLGQGLGKLLGWTVLRRAQALEGLVQRLGGLALGTAEDLVEPLVEVGQLLDRVPLHVLAGLEVLRVRPLLGQLSEQIRELVLEMHRVEPTRGAPGLRGLAKVRFRALLVFMVPSLDAPTRGRCIDAA